MTDYRSFFRSYLPGPEGEADKNMVLRTPDSYDQIVPFQQNIELGVAVAASACIPGIFHPLSISGLYSMGADSPDIRVQLVDGGVHDNQGIQGLLHEKCTLFVVSDASGQLTDVKDPSTSIFSVLMRSQGVLFDRVREAQLFDVMRERREAVSLTHLLGGVPAWDVVWIGPPGRPAEDPPAKTRPGATSESFGVSQDVQTLLARVRTDLDSFTEVEAYSLELDGYLMSGQRIPEADDIKRLIEAAPDAERPPWRFLDVRPWIGPGPTEKRYRKQLAVASQRALKVFRLSLSADVIIGAMLAGLGVGGWFIRGRLPKRSSIGRCRPNTSDPPTDPRHRKSAAQAHDQSFCTLQDVRYPRRGPRTSRSATAGRLRLTGPATRLPKAATWLSDPPRILCLR